MAATNINAFCLSRDEKHIFAGTFSGEIFTVDSRSLALLGREQAHLGSIEVIVRHPTLPFIAAYAKDRRITIWKAAGDGRLTRVHTISMLHVTPGDGEEPFPSTSQALAFHDKDMRLVGHSANGGLTEIKFDETKYEILSCTRAHGKVDVVACRYVKDSDDVLSASVRGDVAIYRDGKLVRAWDLGAHNNRQTVHWFEHVRGDEYLLASDGRHIIKLDITGKTDPFIGPFIARDHLEYVSYNKKSKRAFCASFDRRIYEFHPETCELVKVAFEAPFKCRWIATLTAEPNILIVQCRNGALYRVDLDDNSRVVASLKSTPDTMWTAVVKDEEILVAGEGDKILALRADGEDEGSRTTRMKARSTKYTETNDTFAKRMVVSPSGNVLALGRTDGTVVVGNAVASLKEVARFPEAVRDLCFGKDDSEIFVACEDGHLYQMSADGAERKSIYGGEVPLWALAYHPARRLLAIGHRFDRIELLDVESGKKTLVTDTSRFCKRLRWCDEDRLLISNTPMLQRYTLSTGTLETLQKNFPNTAEDFDWDADRRYLVVANYSRFLYLLDYESGKILDGHASGLSYTKGVMFLPRSLRANDYGGDFIGFGRDSTTSLMRIHDDRIITLASIQ